MTRTVDFDAFRAEQHEEPVVFKIGGEVYFLPSSLPAAIAVDVIRLRAETGDRGEVPLETLNTFGVACFGEELWRTVLDKHRVTIAEIPTLLEKVLEVYSDDPKLVAATEAALSPTSEAPTSDSSSSTTGPG